MAAHPGENGRTLFDADLRGGCCVVLGHEGHGIRENVLAACHERVSVPMTPGVDSLNVASCAAMFLYEAARQRRKVR